MNLLPIDLRKQQSSESVTTEPQVPKRYLKMYGERNTNTNYLSQLVASNLNVKEISGVVPPFVMRLQRWMLGRELVRDVYFGLTFATNLGWKHSKVVSPESLREQALLQSGVGFVTLTKNPYSWLLSLYRRPYHQYYRRKPSFESFLTSPWKTIRRDNCSKVLSSPVELWNVKNRSYLQLAEFDCIQLTTEALFQSPANVIDDISRRFSVSKKLETFQNVHQSTKEKGRDFSYYQNYYLAEHWRDDLSDEAIDIINDALDRKLVKHYGYEIIE